MNLRGSHHGYTARRLFMVLVLSCIFCLMYWMSSRAAVPTVLSIIFKLGAVESAFDQFFTGNKVSGFMAEYKANCRPGRLLFAAHMGTTNQWRVGYGSSLNIQANCFIVADEEKIRNLYQFQFVIYNWVYESFETFFEDFARDTPCPLFKNLNSTEFEALKKNESYTMDYSNGSLTVWSNGSVFILHPALLTDPAPGTRRKELEKLYERVGVDYFFAKKSALMKSLWQPKPSLKKLLRTLWRNILDDEQRFFGVHIRRGSKIAGNNPGVKLIRPETYALKVRDICRSLGSRCPKNVYLMHDEDWVFQVFQSVLKDSFQVFNIWTLFNRSNITWDEKMKIGAGQDPGWIIGEQAASSRKWRTEQVIIETTILSLSSELICTFSSNICLLSALLRGNHTSQIYSMDKPN